MNKNSLEISGFISRKVNYSESDLILTLITKEHGKVDFIARRARRSKKRFEAGLSYNILYSGHASSQKNRSLWLLSDLAVKEQFPSLLTEFKKISAAAYGTELTREILPYQQKDPHSFELLYLFYKTMDTLANSAPLVAWLQYNTLIHGGFMAPFSHCSRCAKERISGVWTVSIHHGGLICESCGDGSNIWFKSSEIDWITDQIPTTPYIDVAKRMIPSLSTLVTNIIGKKLKSAPLLVF